MGERLLGCCSSAVPDRLSQPATARLQDVGRCIFCRVPRLTHSNVDRRAEIFLSDYAGHPFTYEAAIGLHRSYWRTTYSYCATTVSPKGRLADQRIKVIPVTTGRTFEKYDLRRRLIAELRYGAGVARAVWGQRPTVHVVCNMPLVSLLVIWIACLPRRTKLVIWFQDVQSGLAAQLLGSGWVTGTLTALESFLLRRARRVIAISPELAIEARRRGVHSERLGILENWAPVESLPVRPRNNPWAASKSLIGTTIFLYSGTLARKHNPALLVELARSLDPVGGRVVVVSEGEGSEWLADQVRSHSLPNLTLLPYQPFDDLPDVLGSADVLVVLLEPLAGPFSVPSKTLSYLCAGRPILGAMPLDNSAAITIAERAGAGIVVGPADIEGFCAKALELAKRPDVRATLGTSGRRYAEAHFRESVVVGALATQIRLACGELAV